MANTLDKLKPGDGGIILHVSNKSQAIRRRLTDMGLTPGTRVTVKKLAPLGDPIEVHLRGYDLSLRKQDAALIDMGDQVPAAAQSSGKVHYDSTALRHAEEQMRLDHEHESQNHARPYDASAHDTEPMRIALVGNPNAGKTTLFNALTGSNQYVGNWPGVTVEKKEGRAKVGEREVTIVDLPGIYSLSPYSMEEIVSRDYIIQERPHAIINIIDASNIERNLYLTIQLLELERPMVVALNFMDELEKLGVTIDVTALSRQLGVPVVPISAKNGTNLDRLLGVAHEQMHLGNNTEPDDLYDNFTHQIHHEMGKLLHDRAYAIGIPAHWASIKLLEGDSIVEQALNLDESTKAALQEIIDRYEASSPLGDRETLVADSRYSFIERIVASSVVKPDTHLVPSLSDKIDRVVTHRIWAIPLFLACMLLIFLITFGPIGSALSDGVAQLIDGYLSVWIRRGLESLHAMPWLTSLICDGIIAGVGGVLTFLPQIALLFFFLSLLEDSGYMSRGAFIMDRLLRHFGLSGKAFIPMLMGFGCTVPAVMGARTMENEKDRRLTIMLVPFMSCSARLPVYGLISAAFFGRWAGLVVFGLYILGMVMAIGSGVLFSRTVFTGEPAPFVLELPPYRKPTLHNTMLHLWERVRDFLVRAGTVILVMSVVLWVLESFTPHFRLAENAADSILAVIGSHIAILFRPNGFGVWQAAVALLTGLIAKESVVASLSMFCGFSLTAGSATVALALSGVFPNPLAAFSFLVFVLLYIPCVAAVSAIHREMNSLKWTLASIGWQLLCAYVISALVYQVGSLFL